jgi:hypothetical protein
MGNVVRSRLDVRSDDYRSNLAAMQSLWDVVAELLASVPSIGGQRYVDRHRARGKLLARERIEALVDHDTPRARAVAARRVGERVPDRRRLGERDRRRRGRRVRDHGERHDVPRWLDEPALGRQG